MKEKWVGGEQKELVSWIPKKRKREWAAKKFGLMRLTLNQNQNNPCEAIYRVISLTQWHEWHHQLYGHELSKLQETVKDRKD